MHLLRVLAPASVALGIFACSAFEPETGPLRDSGTAAPTATDPGDNSPSTSGGGYDYGDAAPLVEGGPDPRCAADGGIADNDCDRCENAGCCATRFDCYDDMGCASANMTFDACIASLDAGLQYPPTAAMCWNAFSSSSAIATARVACQRAKCQTVCDVP